MLQISREQKAKMSTQLATMDAIQKGCQGQDLLDYIKSDGFDRAAKVYMDLFNDGEIWGQNEN